jgi:hypothetical protein
MRVAVLRERERERERERVGWCVGVGWKRVRSRSLSREVTHWPNRGVLANLGEESA